MTHLSRSHQPTSQPERTTFKCLLCHFNERSNLTSYFQHIIQHLTNSETVDCVFKGCSYRTNIYGSFRTHRSQNHKNYTVNDLKPEILVKQGSSGGLWVECHDSVQIDIEPSDVSTENLDDSSFDLNDLTHNAELKIASLLLKLEHIYLVSSVAVDELLQEFNYLLGTASVPLVHQTISQHLQNGNCQVDEIIVQELASTICESNPVTAAFGNRGPLSTACKRKTYYKKHFKTVEPTEFVLDSQNKKSFQYISILKSLQQILSCQTFLDSSINFKSPHQIQSDKIQHRCFYDGSYYKEIYSCQKSVLFHLFCIWMTLKSAIPLGPQKKAQNLWGILGIGKLTC